MKFSANLGFLWQELALADAVRAAAAAGFDAVECHWPYDEPIDQVAAALAETGLPMLGLNTRRGDVARGENGLSALPGRGQEARAAIDEAIGYAARLGVPNIHVMAGFAQGDRALITFADNLRYATDRAAAHNMTILIEPLNRHDAPGYFLAHTDMAADIIAAVNAPNLKLMFDFYHVQRQEGDVFHRFEALRPLIGHIQFASVPDRGAPGQGELDLSEVFRFLARCGIDGPLGAEYKPATATGNTLAWLQTQRG